MKNESVVLADRALASENYDNVSNDKRKDLDLVATNIRSIRQDKSLRATNRLMYLGLATIIYAPLVIAGVAFQNNLVYLAPAAPFLAVAFIYFLLRDKSGTDYLKA